MLPQWWAANLFEVQLQTRTLMFLFWSYSCVALASRLESAWCLVTGFLQIASGFPSRFPCIFMLPSTHDATTTKPHIGEWCVYNKAQCNMCFNLMAKIVILLDQRSICQLTSVSQRSTLRCHMRSFSFSLSHKTVTSPAPGQLLSYEQSLQSEPLMLQDPPEFS